MKTIDKMPAFSHGVHRGNLVVAIQFAEAGVAVFSCFEAKPRANDAYTRWTA